MSMMTSKALRTGSPESKQVFFAQPTAIDIPVLGSVPDDDENYIRISRNNRIEKMSLRHAIANEAADRYELDIIRKSKTIKTIYSADLAYDLNVPAPSTYINLTGGFDYRFKITAKTSGALNAQVLTITFQEPL